MSDLYEADFVVWSEQQAERLRRLARGEQVNDIDWPHLIEEVDALGRSATSAVRGLLLRAIEHLLKAAAWPDAPSARKWRHEADVLLGDAQLDWTPGMAQHIDLPRVYARALANVRGLAYAEDPAGPLPETCPVTLAELIAGEASALAGGFRPQPLQPEPPGNT